MKMHSKNKDNIWFDGIMGVVVGDALGCPVQFMSRSEIREHGLVTEMEGYGTYNMPIGTWTDDSSMTLALLASICEKGVIDLEDIMKRFVIIHLMFPEDIPMHAEMCSIFWMRHM